MLSFNLLKVSNEVSVQLISVSQNFSPKHEKLSFRQSF